MIGFAFARRGADAFRAWQSPDDAREDLTTAEDIFSEVKDRENLGLVRLAKGRIGPPRRITLYLGRDLTSDEMTILRDFGGPQCVVLDPRKIEVTSRGQRLAMDVADLLRDRFRLFDCRIDATR